MSTQQITPDQANAPILHKSMLGKYDGRVKANKARIVKSPGRKPNHAKHLAKNSAAHIFKVCDIRQRVIELLDSPDARLRFEVIRYVWDRLEGKPFVAENPNSSKQPGVIDNRLQVAIQNLVIPANTKKAKKKGNVVLDATVSALELPACSTEAIQAGAKVPGGQ